MTLAGSVSASADTLRTLPQSVTFDLNRVRAELGAAQLVLVPIEFPSTGMNGMPDDLFRRTGATGVPLSTVGAFEDEGRDVASSSRHKRALLGTVALIFGAISLASTLTLLGGASTGSAPSTLSVSVSVSLILGGALAFAALRF